MINRMYNELAEIINLSYTEIHEEMFFIQNFTIHKVRNSQNSNKLYFKSYHLILIP